MAIVVNQGSNCSMMLNGITNSTATFQDTADAPFRNAGTGFGDTTNNPNLEIHQAAAGNADAAFTITATTPNTQVTISPAAGATHNPTPYLFGRGAFSSSDWSKHMAAAVKSAQVQGDHITVFIVAFSTTLTINTPTDTSGNTYQLAVTGQNATLGATIWVYYAENVAPASANANFVDVSFTTAIPDDAVSISVVSESGLALKNSLDVAQTNTGNTTTPTSTSFSTAYANEVVYGACALANHVTATQAGYTNLLTGNDTFGNTVEYQIFTTKQTSITTNMTQATGQWLFATVSFKSAADVASFVPVEVEPRGKGRAILVEDPPVESRQTNIHTSVGWIPVEVEPRGKGRALIEPEPVIEPRITGVVITDVASYAGVDVERPGKLKPPVVADSGSTQAVPFTDVASFSPVEVEPRGKGRTPIEADLNFDKTVPLLTTGWVPVDVEPRGKGRQPLTEEFPVETKAAGISSVGWVDVPVEPRGKGRAPLAEDPPLEARQTGISESVGWVGIDVEPRGRGRANLTEDFLGTRITPPALDNIASWAPVEVDPRGKGRAPLAEDPPIQARQTGLSESVGWVDVPVEPRGRGRFPLTEPDPLVESKAAGISSVGWVDVEVNPRGRGRGVIPEDPPVQGLHIVVLPTIGWLPVDVDPRGKGRAVLPEDPPVEKRQVTISSIGWVDVDLTPRKKGAFALDVELPGSGPTPIVFPPVLPPPSPPAPVPGGGGGWGPRATFDAVWAPLSTLYAPPNASAQAEQYEEERDADDERAELEEEETAQLIEELQRRAGWPRDSETPATYEPERGPSETAQPEATLPKSPDSLPKTKAQPEVAKAQLEKPRTFGAEPLSNPLPKAVWIGVAVVGAAAVVAALTETPAAKRKVARERKVPEWATLNERWVRCGKPECRTCPHGPFYYWVWRDEKNPKKLRSKYIGREKPK